MQPDASIPAHTLSSRLRGSAAVVFLVLGGLIASALVVPLLLFGGRRNRAQHLVERLWASGTLAVAGIRVEVRGRHNLPANATRHIFVKRGRSKSGGRALEAAANELRKGAWVLLFPEGTRSTSGESLPWKTGAFRLAIDAQVPIVPTVIHNARFAWPAQSILPRSGTMIVEFLEPVSSEGVSAKHYGQLRNQVRDLVISSLEG
jgi:1-acyl-sn-glycerol-3-phosphate acyltransferase